MHMLHIPPMWTTCGCLTKHLLNATRIPKFKGSVRLQVAHVLHSSFELDMQSNSMLDEVDAIKRQLKLLGHDVPTNVIVQFLQNNNQLFPTHGPADGRDDPSQSFLEVQKQSQQPLYLKNPSGLQRPVDQQQLPGAFPAIPSPQLDTTWAGAPVASAYPGAIGKAAQPWPHDETGFEKLITRCAPRQASTVCQDTPDQEVCQLDRGFTEQQACAQTGVPNSSAQSRSFTDYEDEYTALKKTLEELNASLDEQQPFPYLQPLSQPHAAATAVTHADMRSKGSKERPTGLQSGRKADGNLPGAEEQQAPQLHAAQTDAAPLHRKQFAQQNGHVHDDKDWYKQDAAMFGDSTQRDSNPIADLQQEPSYAQSHRSQCSNRRDNPARSVLGSVSLRNLPVLTNSFIVPAEAAKPKKVDRVNRHKELQQAWNKDSFLKSGGTAKNSKRRSENFNELFAACHAAEDRLKDLTLKHGRAVKAVAPGSSRRQQENVVPTAKRRDALRWETRMRMQIREDVL